MTKGTLLAAGAAALLAALALAHSRPATTSDRFAPFDVVGLGGERVRSGDLAGRVLLVNLWASWCAPCREELPGLDSMAARFDTARVVFLALSDDVDGAAARQFLLAFRLDHLRIGLGLGGLKRTYRYPGLPFTMLVDPRGRLARTWYGYGGPPQLAAVDSTIRAQLEGAN